jgi:hypothetical protein
MRIRFERTGGFANVPLRAELDSAQMPPGRKQELEKLVAGARPFDQPPQSQGAATPDDLHYEVTFEDAGRTHTLRTSDTSAGDELKLLLDFLGEEALKRIRG